MLYSLSLSLSLSYMDSTSLPIIDIIMEIMHSNSMGIIGIPSSIFVNTKNIRSRPGAHLGYLCHVPALKAYRCHCCSVPAMKAYRCPCCSVSLLLCPSHEGL